MTESKLTLGSLTIIVKYLAMMRGLLRQAALLWAVVIIALLAGGASASRDVGGDDDSGISNISLADLPVEARETLRLIHAGGPFPYARDGIGFGNRERLLPRRPRDYYVEYTVRTPGARDRGARRIIAGRGGEMYYTDDHYRTFRRILE